VHGARSAVRDHVAELGIRLVDVAGRPPIGRYGRLGQPLPNERVEIERVDLVAGVVVVTAAVDVEEAARIVERATVPGSGDVDRAAEDHVQHGAVGKCVLERRIGELDPLAARDAEVTGVAVDRRVGRDQDATVRRSCGVERRRTVRTRSPVTRRGSPVWERCRVGVAANQRESCDEDARNRA
jgi:hypothetical protein